MSWFTDEEKAAMAALTAARAHPALLTARKKLDAINADVHTFAPEIAVLNTIYPPLIPVETVFEAVVTAGQALLGLVTSAPSDSANQ